MERWQPHVFANRNRDGAELLRKINTAVAEHFPGVLMISDDASPFPKVTTPVEKGGLGFDYAANTNWILDLLQYISFPEVYRGLNRDKLSYWLDYPQEERALLACDHNQIVHGKRSILARLSGDYWEQFAMLRAFWGYMICFPGGKLQFMGSEFGQFSEWNFEKSLDWVRLNHTIHQDLQRYVKELSALYKLQSPLWDSPSESGFRS